MGWLRCIFLMARMIHGILFFTKIRFSIFKRHPVCLAEWAHHAKSYFSSLKSFFIPPFLGGNLIFCFFFVFYIIQILSFQITKQNFQTIMIHVPSPPLTLTTTTTHACNNSKAISLISPFFHLFSTIIQIVEGKENS